MSDHIEIASLLIDIEAELRRLRQWQFEPPSAQALASTEPFCVDKLTFVQWLQFIFLPRMHALAAARQLPPGRCEIKPLAEEYFGDGKLDVGNLLRVIGELDAAINGQD
ncbi:MAG TPA: YqcC family protein [Spongiibacteraceae bacterium]|jgi:uncharacterized protein YqcC (DUF446 family)